MNFAFTFFVLYILFFLFILYVFIFGNNKCHRNTCIGSIYRFFTIKLPDSLNIFFRRLFHLKPPGPNDDYECTGKGGPCRYLIFVFFALLYGALVLDYFIFTYPYISLIYRHATLNRILSFVIPSIPWVIVTALQFMDPGVITEDNVEDYLKKYPFDHVLYKEKMCPTDHIPVVPRSRYCGYTHRRVAKYDHYCPWVLQSIGERTHRWFLLFLISCTVASIYYCIGDILVIAINVMYSSRRVKWTNSKANNFLICIFIIMKLQKFNAAAVIMFLVIILTLVFFIGQQCYYISINKTQIELDKYEEEYYRRKERGMDTNIPNFYDKGVIENWKEFLFPAPIKKSRVPWKPDTFWKKVIKNEEKMKEERIKKLQQNKENSKPKEE